ncbi:hypothetical protein [Serratia fonticola]|uniref:hypothetical protein n=1 Tax=Serratia fonticola TaxID=47917 RepID=UPI00217950B4|nr:hypothetical protein [Serratia fonticola]CAI1540685.1 Uncharacterised protein [Serratia fonticola]CAI1997630.1 Uncharacterised protein [Serratia fonticola]CAI2000360.1 Uncharacterised protein [Serratia fonticola]
MKKSYYLKYGSDKTKEELKELLEKKWGIICAKHDSSYFGVYFNYSGLYADKLTITGNYIASSKEWLHEESKGVTSLINVSIFNGENTEKLSRYKLIKKFFVQLNVDSVIIDKCIEED